MSEAYFVTGTSRYGNLAAVVVCRRRDLIIEYAKGYIMLDAAGKGAQDSEIKQLLHQIIFEWKWEFTPLSELITPELESGVLQAQLIWY